MARPPQPAGAQHGPVSSRLQSAPAEHSRHVCWISILCVALALATAVSATPEPLPFAASQSDQFKNSGMDGEQITAILRQGRRLENPRHGRVRLVVSRGWCMDPVDW